MSMNIETHAKRSRRVTVVTSLLAIFIIFVLLLAYQFVSGRQQLMEELRTEAKIIGANSSAALVFKDEKAASEILSAIRLTPRIVGAALYYWDGTLFISENDSAQVFPQVVEGSVTEPLPSVESHSGLFASLMREEVYQDETRVGTLLIHFTEKDLYWHLVQYALGVIVIVAIGLLLAHRFTVRLRKQIALTEDQLQQMALYDQVTGLPNRSFFRHELGKAVVRIRREGGLGALLYLDVDEFKKVNDLCGHQVGDQVLSMISQRLKQTVRAADIVARVGGDEFAVILFGIGAPEYAARIAEQMIAAISEPFPTRPAPSHVGLSIGVVMIPSDSDDPETLLRWSDMAMSVAKSQGRNGYQFYSDEINARVHGSLQMESGLRQALKEPDGGLWVAYQPQVNAKTREIVGVEALMRWRRADGAFISPGEFIPVAEKTGLIVDLGAWMVRQICHDLAEMRSLGVELPKVAVNVSPRELTRGVGIVEGICNTLGEFEESVSRFQFELTENALMDDQGAEVLDAFRAAGFTLAIDDFGSGYSSLGYLKRFHVSVLKIDRQFIELLPADAEDAAIVSAVIQMSGALGIHVVAEGVETEAQAAFLDAQGCDTLQGFLISRPLPLADLVAFVKNQSAKGQTNGAN